MDLGNATLSWYRFCLYRLHAGRFQRCSLEMQRCLDSICIACTQGGSKSGPWECHLVFVSSAQGEAPKVDLGNVTLSWYRLFVSPARREVPKVDLGNATLSWYRLFVSSARREVPKVDLGNATLSWYRLFVSPARGEVPKVDLGNAI